MNLKSIRVETTEIDERGEKTNRAYDHQADSWSTAQGGDLLVVRDRQAIAIYARGVWKRAYYPDPEGGVGVPTPPRAGAEQP